jgi:hypothetical protein
VGASAPSSPMEVSWGEGRLDLFAHASGGLRAIYHKAHVPSQGWEPSVTALEPARPLWDHSLPPTQDMWWRRVQIIWTLLHCRTVVKFTTRPGTSTPGLHQAAHSCVSAALMPGRSRDRQCLDLGVTRN